MWLSGGSVGGVGGGSGDTFFSGGAFTVGPAGPMPPVITTWCVGFFISDWERNSVTGLKGSLSKNGSLWVSVEVLSSVLGFCGTMGSLSRWEAGGPGCKTGEKVSLHYPLFMQQDKTTRKWNICVLMSKEVLIHILIIFVLTTLWTLLTSSVKGGVSVSFLNGGSWTLLERSGLPGGSLELGMRLNKCLSPSSQIRLSSFLSRAKRPGGDNSRHSYSCYPRSKSQVTMN